MPSYTTVKNLKEELGISETTDDQLLQSIIDEVSAAIDNYCKRTFQADSDTTRYFAVYEDTDHDMLYFDEDLAAAPTSVINKADNGTGGETIASTEYILLPRNRTPHYGLRLLSSSSKHWEYTLDAENGIEVTGRWAYSINPPEPIRRACQRWASFYYKQKDQPLFDVTTVEAGVVISPQGMPNDVKMMLNPLVRVVS